MKEVKKVSKVIRISSSNYERLKSLSRGFEHPYQVIDRLLDYYDQHHKDKGELKEGGGNCRKRKPNKKESQRLNSGIMQFIMPEHIKGRDKKDKRSR